MSSRGENCQPSVPQSTFACGTTGTEGSHQLVEAELRRPRGTRKWGTKSQVTRDQHDASLARHELSQRLNQLKWRIWLYGLAIHGEFTHHQGLQAAAAFIGFVATSPIEGKTSGAEKIMADPILSDQINHYLHQEEVNLKGFCLASQQLIESRCQFDVSHGFLYH